MRSRASSVGAQGSRDLTTMIFAQNIVIGGSPPMLLTIRVGSQNEDISLILLLDSSFSLFRVTARVVLYSPKNNQKGACDVRAAASSHPLLLKDEIARILLILKV